MPELPEVEQVRRSLEPHLIGARVDRVIVRRQDVIHTAKPLGARALRVAMLQRDVVDQMQRLGKHLAIIGRSGRVVCVHLGMSGHLQFVLAGQKLAKATHVHCVWHLRTAKGDGQLVFRDPRRFGGLWPFATVEDLHQSRWAALGPDAITINAELLHERIRSRQRPIKSALLDQSVIAGVGNIYADEALFRAGIHPRSVCMAIPEDSVRELAHAIRAVLREAVASGGSTIRSYLDGAGASGAYAQRLRVYGRAGSPCVTCGRTLRHCVTAQRSTVFCSECQVRVS